MFEKLKSFRLINRVVQERETRDRKMAEKVTGVRKDVDGKNIPVPWAKREWGKTRQIGDLPAAVGDVTGASGPRKTMYGSVTPEPILNPKLFKDIQNMRPPRPMATRQWRSGEPNIAIDSTDRGIARSNKPAPPRKSKTVRLAQMHRGHEQHSVALDNREKVRGFHPSEFNPSDTEGPIAIDNWKYRLFGQQDLIKWAFSKISTFWDQTVFGQMLHQVRPDVLGRLIESKNRPLGSAAERFRGMAIERIENPSRRGH